MTGKELTALAGIVLGGGGGFSGYTFLQDYWRMQDHVSHLVKEVDVIRADLDGELAATKAAAAKMAYRIQLCLDGALPEESCKGLGVYMPEKRGPTTMYFGGSVGEDGKWRPESQSRTSQPEP